MCPIPSIPVLLTAGTLSATHRLNGPLALLAVLAACLLADSVWYLLGRRYGNAVLKLLCRFSFEASTCVNKTEGYFERRGAVTLLFAKFVPGLSTVAAPIAGQTGMPYGRFVIYDLAGSAFWALAYLLAGFFFGDVAQRSQRFFSMLGHFAVADLCSDGAGPDVLEGLEAAQVPAQRARACGWSQTNCCG